MNLKLIRALSVTLPAAAMLTGIALAQSSFRDHRGTKIDFQTPPERVVTIVRSAPIVYAAVDGTTEHIVGQNWDSLDRYFESGIYAELLPALAKVDATAAREGFAPNVEAILRLKPDAVIQWIFDPEIIEPLERVGLKVVGWDCCTKQHRLDYLTISGYMSGRNDRAQMLVGLQAESDDALRALWQDTPESDFVRMLVVDQLGDQIRVVANGSDDYGLSGVNNLAADSSGEWWRTIDAEQFLVWNPDLIVIPFYADLEPGDFYANPLLESVSAIRNRRVYKIPEFTSTPDAPEIYLAAVWLARLAHGEMVAPDFRSQLVTAYEAAYGQTLTEAQIDRVLAMEANAGSEGYTRLFR